VIRLAVLAAHLSLAAASLLVAAPAPAQDDCRLCFADTANTPGARPLAIEIWADLNFSKLALTGRSGGAAELDPASGAKRTSGELIDLGGLPINGHGRITGEPFREISITLPQRVMMTAPDGGHGELTNFVTSLPPHPALDGNGILEFTFGARLELGSNRGGNLRGRIPISVDYN
jgi:hypothetical protein